VLRSRRCASTGRTSTVARAATVALAAAAIAIGGCHQVTRVDETILGEVSLRRRNDGVARPLEPTAIVTPSGRLRFVEPLLCGHDELVEQSNYQVIKTEPNVALVVVGLIAVSLGVVGTVAGFKSQEPASSPFTYVGPTAIGAGAPMLVAPFIGNGTERVGIGETEAIRGRRDAPCGERPVQAIEALLAIGNLRARGDVDQDGVLSLSPFDFVDAFGLGRIRPIAGHATLSMGDGVGREVDFLLDPTALAAGRDGWLAGLGIDARVEPLTKVPRLEVTGTRLVRTRDEVGAAALRLELSVENSGPGDAWGVRGVLSSKNPLVDGRIVYVGRVAARSKGSGSRILAATPSVLERGDASLTMELRDAHDTAPRGVIDLGRVVPVAEGKP
jgi:hypothetical protein